MPGPLARAQDALRTIPLTEPRHVVDAFLLLAEACRELAVAADIGGNAQAGTLGREISAQARRLARAAELRAVVFGPPDAAPADPVPVHRCADLLRREG